MIIGQVPISKFYLIEERHAVVTRITMNYVSVNTLYKMYRKWSRSLYDSTGGANMYKNRSWDALFLGGGATYPSIVIGIAHDRNTVEMVTILLKDVQSPTFQVGTIIPFQIGPILPSSYEHSQIDLEDTEFEGRLKQSLIKTEQGWFWINKPSVIDLLGIATVMGMDHA